ncbi:hypothetical protein [Qipengyuania sp.]|uniref:hypothetical protein n=1 Tax=Qipengyuania sp. TaxID=2004515 RepID=UPI0035C7B91D
MTLRHAIAFAAPLALALSACGSSDNASTEAEADTVEIPANEALEGVEAMPVEDPDANTQFVDPADDTTPAETEEDRIQAAGDSAADTAAAAADAMGDMETEEQ